MKKEYKYLIISGTLGLIEGGSDGLRDCLIRRWKLLYPDIEAEIKVNLDSVKYITEGQYKGCAMPKMTVSLTVDNESYSFVRDWEREQLLNNVKPEYHNDDDFEIVGEANHGSDNEYDLFKPQINGKETFKRILIKRRKRQR